MKVTGSKVGGAAKTSAKENANNLNKTPSNAATRAAINTTGSTKASSRYAEPEL